MTTVATTLNVIRNDFMVRVMPSITCTVFNHPKLYYGKVMNNLRTYRFSLRRKNKAKAMHPNT
jgi:hypothetical protein